MPGIYGFLLRNSKIMKEIDASRLNNWEKVFKKYFEDNESLRSKLHEIETYRNDIAHSRLLTQKEFEDLTNQITKLENRLVAIEKCLGLDE